MFWVLLLLLAWVAAGTTCTRLCLASVRAAAVVDDETDRFQGRGLTLYEAAFLSGGPARVAELTLVSMARQRRLLLAHTVPEALHGRLFALHKTCTSGAFVIAFVLAGALISTLGIQAMFLCGGLALMLIIVMVRPPLRALWPEPATDTAAPLQPRPEPT